MKAWMRLSLLLLTIGGGFCGFAVTWQALLTFRNPQFINVTLCVIFLVLYGLVIASGLLFAQNQNRISPLFISFALQVPWISSPLLCYRFTAGFHATIGLIGGHPNAGISLGSDWQCALFRDFPWGCGVNVFALFIAVGLILRLRKTKKLQTASRPDLTESA